MSLESDFDDIPEKLIWTKVIVEDIKYQNPDGPTIQVHELTLSHFPYPGWDNGVFLQHLQSSLISDGEPELSMIHIKRAAVPELITALQKYMLLQSQNPQESQ